MIIWSYYLSKNRQPAAMQDIDDQQCNQKDHYSNDKCGQSFPLTCFPVAGRHNESRTHTKKRRVSHCGIM